MGSGSNDARARADVRSESRLHYAQNGRGRGRKYRLRRMLIGLVGAMIKTKIQADFLLRFAMRRLLRAGCRGRGQRAQTRVGGYCRLRKEHCAEHEKSSVPEQASSKHCRIVCHPGAVELTCINCRGRLRGWPRPELRFP